MPIGRITKILDTNDINYININTVDYSDLNTLITSLGSDKRTVVISSSINLTSNLEIPDNITIKLENEGVINISTYTLRIMGAFECSLKQAFTFSTGTVFFGHPEYGKNNNVPEVYTEWFGAKGDGIVNCTNAFEMASKSTRGTIRLTTSTYNLTKFNIRYSQKWIGDTTFLVSLPSSEIGFINIMGFPTWNIQLKGVRLFGNVSNTLQHGLYCDSLDEVNGGETWYSTFDDLYISGFTGHGIHFNGTNFNHMPWNASTDDIANQFLIFRNVTSVSNGTASSRALYINGQFGQVLFDGCEFDGTGKNNVGSIGTEIKTNADNPVGQSDEPYTLIFNGCTFQSHELAIKTSYAHNIIFTACHFEDNVNGFYLDNRSEVTIEKCMFMGTGKAVSGDGYIVKNVISNVKFLNNLIYSRTHYDYIIDNVNGYKNVIENTNFFIDDDNDAIPLTRTTVDTKNMITGYGIDTNGVMKTYYSNYGLAWCSVTPLTVINSWLDVGQRLTITAWPGGPGSENSIIIKSGGNIVIPANSNQSIEGVVIRDRESATFIRTDVANSMVWILESTTNSMSYSTMIPTTGRWYVGEFLRNANPQSGTPQGWVCTASGYPGTWKALANIP